MQQKLLDLLRHPLTGELPAGFRQPRATCGEVGPQPFYRIAGAEDETAEEKAARLKAEADAAADDNELKFTQKQLADKAAEEKRQGKRAATRELMEKFGFETVEEAEAFINERRDADDKAKSAADKAAETAAKEKTASEKARREAEAEKRNASIERALVRLGVDTGDEDDDDEGDLPDAAILLARDLDDDADADDIRTAAKALKERRPELFNTEVTTTTKKSAALIPGGKRGNRKTPDGVKPGEGGRNAAKRRGFKLPGETTD